MVLADEDKKKVKDFLEGVKLKLLMFDSEKSEHSKLVEALLRDLDEVSGVSYEVHQVGGEAAQKHGIETAPVILLEDHPNVRYFGIPSGHEFMPFLNLLKVSTTKEFEINEKVQQAVKAIEEPVDIKVFITPTCPYCAGTVMASHLFAVLNPKITSTMVECMEYRDMATEYEVSAVPKIVVNGEKSAEGALGPEALLALIKGAD